MTKMQLHGSRLPNVDQLLLNGTEFTVEIIPDDDNASFCLQRAEAITAHNGVKNRRPEKTPLVLAPLYGDRQLLLLARKNLTFGISICMELDQSIGITVALQAASLRLELLASLDSYHNTIANTVDDRESPP